MTKLDGSKIARIEGYRKISGRAECYDKGGGHTKKELLYVLGYGAKFKVFQVYEGFPVD